MRSPAVVAADRGYGYPAYYTPTGYAYPNNYSNQGYTYPFTYPYGGVSMPNEQQMYGNNAGTASGDDSPSAIGDSEHHVYWSRLVVNGF